MAEFFALANHGLLLQIVCCSGTQARGFEFVIQ